MRCLSQLNGAASYSFSPVDTFLNKEFDVASAGDLLTYGDSR